MFDPEYDAPLWDDPIKYPIDENGFIIKDGMLLRYCGTEANPTLPVGIRVIGEFSFMGIDTLQSITLPNTVVHIGASAFWDCPHLQSVTFPATVRIIGRKILEGSPNAVVTAPAGSYAAQYAAENGIPLQLI